MQSSKNYYAFSPEMYRSGRPLKIRLKQKTLLITPKCTPASLSDRAALGVWVYAIRVGRFYAVGIANGLQGLLAREWAAGAKLIAVRR